MDLATLSLFLPACFALNMAPGPNNLLSVSNSTRYGYRTACLAGAGRLLAFAGMIALASAGLAVVLQTSELLFPTSPSEPDPESRPEIWFDCSFSRLLDASASPPFAYALPPYEWPSA